MAEFCSSAVHSTFSQEGLKKHLWLQPTASAALEAPGENPTLGPNPALMLLCPLQRRPLQPRRVLEHVAGWRAEHHDAHSLLGLPALRRDDRSQPGKGTDTRGVSVTGANAGVQGLPLLCQSWPGQPQPAAQPRGLQQQRAWGPGASVLHVMESADVSRGSEARGGSVGLVWHPGPGRPVPPPRSFTV